VCLLTLDCRWRDDDLHRKSPPDDVPDIVDHGAGLGRDDPDPCGKYRKRPFPFSGKQVQSGEFLLPLLDKQVFFAKAGLLYCPDLQLIGAVRGIHNDRPGDHHLHPFSRGERKPVGIRPPHHALDHCCG
jgi:hypothetical protein